jgi:hypothetical protein
MAPSHPPQKRYRCTYCGTILPAWLPMAREVNGAMLLHHLTQQHPAEARAYLARMHRTEDISPVAAEAFEMIEEPPPEVDQN